MGVSRGGRQERESREEGAGDSHTEVARLGGEVDLDDVLRLEDGLRAGSRGESVEVGWGAHEADGGNEGRDEMEGGRTRGASRARRPRVSAGCRVGRWCGRGCRRWTGQGKRTSWGRTSERRRRELSDATSARPRRPRTRGAERAARRARAKTMVEVERAVELCVERERGGGGTAARLGTSSRSRRRRRRRRAAGSRSHLEQQVSRDPLSPCPAHSTPCRMSNKQVVRLLSPFSPLLLLLPPPPSR